MSEINMIRRFREIVHEYALNHLDASDQALVNKFAMADVYVVWSCKVLQNYKALISTTLLDGMYYELTYNGDKNEIYLDAYKKFENMRIPLPPAGSSDFVEQYEKDVPVRPPFDFSIKGDIEPTWARRDRLEEKEGF